jgi:hypothetical protein
MFSRSIIEDSRSIIEDSRSIIEDSRSIIEDSRSINDTIVSDATIWSIIYNHNMCIIQVTGVFVTISNSN